MQPLKFNVGEIWMDGYGHPETIISINDTTYPGAPIKTESGYYSPEGRLLLRGLRRFAAPDTSANLVELVKAAPDSPQETPAPKRGRGRPRKNPLVQIPTPRENAPAPICDVIPTEMSPEVRRLHQDLLHMETHFATRIVELECEVKRLRRSIKTLARTKKHNRNIN